MIISSRFLKASSPHRNFPVSDLQLLRSQLVCTVPSVLNQRIWVFEMKFIMEFAEDLILRLMEDPKERDRKFREHVYATKERCNKTKEMWSYPVRPYGFWTFPRQNAQLAWDAQISQVPGRRDPYDDLLSPNER